MRNDVREENIQVRGTQMTLVEETPSQDSKYGKD